MIHRFQLINLLENKDLQNKLLKLYDKAVTSDLVTDIQFKMDVTHELIFEIKHIYIILNCNNTYSNIDITINFINYVIDNFDSNALELIRLANLININDCFDLYKQLYLHKELLELTDITSYTKKLLYNKNKNFIRFELLNEDIQLFLIFQLDKTDNFLTNWKKVKGLVKQEKFIEALQNGHA